MVQIFNTLLETALDSTGSPISGAKLFIYEAGTTTKLTTYSDSALTTANANPLIADSAGRFVPIYGNADDYKFVLTTADDTDPPTSPISTKDNYTIASAASFSGGINSGGFTQHIANAQTGTSYTILDGDRAKNLSFSNASSIAVALPQANSTTFIDGWYTLAYCVGAGTTTITPTTSTINGAATLVLKTGESAIIISDGVNYRAYAISKDAIGLGTTDVVQFGGTRSVVTTVTSTSNATTIDLSVSDTFKHTFTEDTTFTFSNPAATGILTGFTLLLINDGTGRTPTWPASVDWQDGVAPTLTTASETNILTFHTFDGGTIWFGALAIGAAA